MNNVFMPKQILDEPLFDVELDEKQIRLTQLKRRCLVLWAVCIGTWAAVQFLFVFILDYWPEAARVMMPTFYINVFVFGAMFTPILLKPHKPKKTNLLWNIVQHILVFGALYAIVVLCFAGASLLLALLGSKLSLLNLNQYWTIYLSFLLSSGGLMLGVFFFLKPELSYTVDTPSEE